MQILKFNFGNYSRLIIFSFLFGVPVYLFTFFILNNYTVADSSVYSDYWDFVKSVYSFDDAHNGLPRYINSYDIGYSIIIWFATRLPFSRVEFFSILNAIIVTFSGFYFCKNFSFLPSIYSILFLGYYFPSLIIAPERLHLSVFLIIISFFFSSYPIRLSLTVFALLTHTSSFLFLIGIYCYLYFDQLKLVFASFIRGILAIKFMLGLVVLVLLYFCILVFNPSIPGKILSYSQSFYGLKQLSSILLLFIAYYFRIASGPLTLGFASILFVSFAVLGSYIDRSLIFLYFLYVIDYLALNKHNPQQNLVFVFILLWSAAKSLSFYGNLLNGGGGYG